MRTLILEHTARIRAPNDTLYSPRVFGEDRGDGTWEGWIEFEPLGPLSPVLTTPRETTQPNRDALLYWATGLEPVYFEGALERAHRGRA